MSTPGPWIAIEFDATSRRARVAGFSRDSAEAAAAATRPKWFKGKVFEGSDVDALAAEIRAWLGSLGVETAEALRRVARRIEARLTESP